MAFQFSEAVRNAWLDAIETYGGGACTLQIRTGGVPATCATADAGTVLVTITLPADWMAAAATGAKAKAGTWEDASADATGTAGHFRVYQGGTTCFIQGAVTATGGGGEMTVANTSIAATQTVTITSFTLTAGGA